MIFRWQRWSSQNQKREVLARLQAPGCPVCFHNRREVSRDLFWFINEKYYEPEVITQLRHSYGFCPSHTRLLLRTGASSVIGAVFLWMIRHALARLREAQAKLGMTPIRWKRGRGCRRAAKILSPRATCLLCRESQWWEDRDIALLDQTLPEAEVQQAFLSSDGLCLPHFRRAALRTEWDTFHFLCSDIRQRLSKQNPCESLGVVLMKQVAGFKLDRSPPPQESYENQGPQRALQGSKGDAKSADAPRGSPGSWSPTLTWIRTALSAARCPVCKACERGLQDYLRWLSGQMEKIASHNLNWDMAWQVCPVHLWDFYEAGHAQAATAHAERIRQNWLAKLDKIKETLADRPADRWLKRLVEVLPKRSDGPLELKKLAPRDFMGSISKSFASPRRKLDQIRSLAFRETECQACYHLRETADRTIDLILRVLEDPVGRFSYREGSGLCLRHCISAAGLAEDASVLSEMLSSQIARLRLLEWELEEVSRKENWSVRYEPKGPEKSAWRRAAHQFCGL